MEESTLQEHSKTESEQQSEQENKEHLRAEHFARKTHLPRRQNSMVAEKTSDMFFSGLMSE